MKRSKHQARGFGTLGIIGIIAVLIVGGFIVLGGDDNDSSESSRVTEPRDEAQKAAEMMEDQSKETDEAMKDDTTMVEDHVDAMGSDSMKDEMETNVEAEGSMETDINVMQEPTAEETTAGTYEVYSEDKLARAEGGDVVLFFHAGWCPSCRSLEKNIQENLSAIPDGTHILKVDYDSATDLKKKYGVTSQHTLVHVDASGNLIKKWSGSSSLSSVVSKI